MDPPTRIGAASPQRDEAFLERRVGELEAERDRLAGELAALARRYRQAEQELEDSGVAERRWRLLAQAVREIKEGVVITDARFAPPGPEILFVNDFFCEMTGWPCDELVGQPLERLATSTRALGKNLDRIAAALDDVGWFRGEVRLPGRSGAVLSASLHVSPVSDAAGRRTHLVAVLEDISEKRRAEEALRASEERYRLLIERMNEGFVATDAENRFDFVNRKAAEMLGYSREELRGRFVGDLVADGDRERIERQEERRRRGEARPYEVTWIARDGGHVDTVVSPTALHDGDGRYVGSFAVLTDVTARRRAEGERRRLEARIQRAQKMESLGVLAGGVAHDFNNLLVGVLGNVGLALMQVGEDSPLRPILEQIETAATRASELTREMLAYSGKGKFVVERLDLCKLVEEMAQLLEVTISRRARLELDCCREVPPIEADPTQVRQVVMNLIVNASEAVRGAGGVIEISTRLLHADRAFLSTTYLDDELPEGRYVCLRVRDDGVGMSPETRVKIFDPFFTTKFTGRGLGLAAALGIVRGHGGAIKVESEEGKGTTFTVLFPVAQGDAPAEPVAPAAPPQPARADARVLVVDDEEMVRSVARACLEIAGYEVVTAADGREAVEIFGREPVDVVLLDMTMPGMGGVETFRQLRALRADAKIVLSSGYDEQESVAAFAGHGLAGFLQKPFQPSELLAILRRVLDEPAAR